MMALLSLIEPASDLPWWGDILVGLAVLGSLIAGALWVFNWITTDFRGRW